MRLGPVERLEHATEHDRRVWPVAPLQELQVRERAARVMSELLLCEPGGTATLAHVISRRWLRVNAHGLDYPACTRMTRAVVYTDREVAAALRKSQRTIQRWCAAGRLPGAFKAGRAWRIPEVALAREQARVVRRHLDGPLDVIGREAAALAKTLETVEADVASASAEECRTVLVGVDALRHAVLQLGRTAQERQRRLAHEGGLDHLPRRRRSHELQ